jgi:hypothetical protein
MLHKERGHPFVQLSVCSPSADRVIAANEVPTHARGQLVPQHHSIRSPSPVREHPETEPAYMRRCEHVQQMRRVGKMHYQSQGHGRTLVL